MRPAPLSEALDAARYGGKAAQLSAALRAGLPVPAGYGLDTALVEAIVATEDGTAEALHAVCAVLSGPVAVRSSAIGEDSKAASFAGQHATILNARSPESVLSAIHDVWKSAHTEAAHAYRDRIGAGGAPRMGVVIQKLVDADMSGVLFTRHPVTGAEELVIEATWGLGEAVVQGLVTPDFFRLDRNGSVIESRAGVKEIAIRRADAGHTESVALRDDLVDAFCLEADHLRALHHLARQCDAAFGDPHHDVEWAFAGDRLYLLQRRPITGTPGSG